MGQSLEPLDSEYSYKEMREALLKGDIVNKVIREFFENADESWPPKVTGIQTYGPNTPVPFDTGYYPMGGGGQLHHDETDPFDLRIPLPKWVFGHASESNIEQMPSENTNWAGLASRTDAEPPMVNLEGWNGYKRIPPEVGQDDPTGGSKLEIPSLWRDLLPKQVGMDFQLAPYLQETIQSLKKDFKWLNDDYREKLKEFVGDGQWLLIRASSEAITDHRREGEQYPRWLQSKELFAMTRTAIGHGADINHMGPAFKTQAFVVDGEFDEDLKEMQLLVHESDPLIIQAITDHTIEAVSINGSVPRITTLEPCKVGTCQVPHGVVLGQDDDIAFTYVITNPNGMFYKGHNLPPAEPGIKSTAIEMI